MASIDEIEKLTREINSRLADLRKVTPDKDTAIRALLKSITRGLQLVSADGVDVKVQPNTWEIFACRQTFLTVPNPEGPPPRPFAIGDRCNWISQPERLIFLGRNWSGNGFWNQFAKVESPYEVWCEVPDEDLHSIELTNQEKG